MPYRFEIEKDPYFIKGIDKGVRKAQAEKDYIFVISLLEETIFSDAKIAALVGVTVKYVEEVRAELVEGIERTFE